MDGGAVYDSDVAASYDNDSHGIYRTTYDDVIALLPRGERYDRALDVGVGTGTMLQRIDAVLRPAELFGLDPSDAMLARASAKLPRLVAVLGDDSALDHDERLRAFDLVIATFVLSYSTPAQMIARAHKVTKPGGIFAVTSTTMNSFQEFLRLTTHPIFRVLSSGYDISPETVEQNLPPVPKDEADLVRALSGSFEIVATKTRRHQLTFPDGRALYEFGREGGWWLDLYRRLEVTDRSIAWVHLGMRACQLLGLIAKPCTTTMETCTVIARRKP